MKKIEEVLSAVLLWMFAGGCVVSGFAAVAALIGIPVSLTYMVYLLVMHYVGG